jgi:group II intron reverse transcriptase/maturase
LKKILHSAIDKVYNWNNLKASATKVAKNKGSGGVDGMGMSDWKKSEDKHISDLRRRLMNDTYRSKPVRRVFIPKPGSSKKRPLGIPTITDRVAQQAVHNILSPVFEEYFQEESHGFRPGRSTKTAARKIDETRKQGYSIVVDIDIRGFFDNVDHEILMRLVRKVVKDRRVLGLIRGWLKAGVMEEGNVRWQVSGTPQGGVISPLLSNIYLTVLDNALADTGIKFVRYADDVLILCRDLDRAQSALELVRSVLTKLKLELNEEKTQISSFNLGFDFLGFHFGRAGRGIGTKSLKSFYRKVREATRRNQGDVPLSIVIENLNPIIRGWGNYHNQGRNIGMFTKLDKWTRNRIRSYVWKRWRDRAAFNVHPSKEELEKSGLLSLRSIFRPKYVQLELQF